MKKDSFANKIQFKIIFSVLVSAAFILLIYFTCGIWFETNDDVFIAEMLSGKLTGVPEYHCPYVSSIITIPISLLYRAFAGVPWWGIFLVSLLFISVFINVFCVVSKGKNLLQILLFTCIEMCIFIAGIHVFGQAQYTCVAIVLAFAGYAVHLSGGEYSGNNIADNNVDNNVAAGVSKRNTFALIIFVICELLACALRDSSMILVQPVCFCALLGVEFYRRSLRQNIKAEENPKEKQNEKQNEKENQKLSTTQNAEKSIKYSATNLLKRIIFALASVIIIILAVKLVSLITFDSPEWKTYLKFNEMRTYAMDYQEKIPAERFSDILDEYGVSMDDFEMMTDHKIWFADGNLSDECLDKLIARYKELKHSAPDFGRIFEAVKQLLFTSSEFWNMHRITAFLFLLVLVFIILSRRPKDLISLGLIFAGYLFGIIFLAYRDRFVLRVMMPYYMGTMLMLSAFLTTMISQMLAGIDSLRESFTQEEAHPDSESHMKKPEQRSRISLIVTGILGLALLIPVFISGRAQFAYVRAQNHNVNSAYLQTMKEISDYCNAHPENSYVLDMGYARFISTDIFETEYYKKANYIYSGSWYSNAPTLMKYSAEYVGKDLCYLVYEAQEFIGKEGTEYYARKLNTQPMEEDSFKLVNGATMHVYRIEQAAEK